MRPKSTLFEGEGPTGEFYQRFTHAEMDHRETKELLFDCFVDKVRSGAGALSVASNS